MGPRVRQQDCNGQYRSATLTGNLRLRSPHCKHFIGLHRGPRWGRCFPVKDGVLVVLLTLTSVAEKDKALVFGNSHLLRGEFRNNQFRTGNQRIRI